MAPLRSNTRTPPPRTTPRHPWFNLDGTPKRVIEIATEVDGIRPALGWLLSRPDTTRVAKSLKPGCWRIQRIEFDAAGKEVGRQDISTDIPEDSIIGLLYLKMLMPSPTNPNEACGNPAFLAENPAWRQFIPTQAAPRK